MKSYIVFGLTIGCWVLIGVLTLRTSMIGFRQTTLHWTHPNTPNSTFHWEQASLSDPATIPVRGSQVLKITVPRSFSTATVTVRYSGALQVTTMPPKGTATLFGIVTSPGIIELRLDQSHIALSNRVFSLRVTGGTVISHIESIDLNMHQ